MPLRDHFHSPVDDVTSWETFHAGWPMVIVQGLFRKLPRRYVAAPHVPCEPCVEIDVPGDEPSDPDSLCENTNVWSPPRPALTVATGLPAQDEYEVRVYDTTLGRGLVAAVEIVSPSNKDRSEHRRAFVAKCAALLQERVSVTIVDLVTTRNFNLYRELLEFIGQADPSLGPEPPSLYAVACRGTKKDKTWLLEAWVQPLTLGQLLPTLPLWLADNLAVPLELEGSYEETCRVFRIP